MALDINKIKNRLNALNQTNTKSNLLWKPTPGKQVVRIVPYKYEPSNPFIELKFHYGLNGKTFLSPDTFHRADPIVEFADKLKSTGDKEDWKAGRNMEPKMRTYVPIIVRGEEEQGVRFWGFGKSVYEELMTIIADPDYGDITDLTNGYDINVEFKTAEEVNKSFPETSIRPRPKSGPAFDSKIKNAKSLLENQTNILDLFTEPSYEELKLELEKWLAPSDGDQASDTTVTEYNAVAEDTDGEQDGAAKTSSDVSAEFDKMFNG